VAKSPPFAGGKVEQVGRIPYDVVTEAMMQGMLLTAFKDGAVTAGLKHVWRRVLDWLVH
jgi:hypothetical protein